MNANARSLIRQDRDSGDLWSMTTSDHAYRTRYSVALAVLVARATRAESRRAELLRSLAPLAQSMRLSDTYHGR